MSTTTSSSSSSGSENDLERNRVNLIVESALASRLKGNEFFKSNDLINALREYHTVLLQLKGLDNRVNQAYGPVDTSKSSDESFADKPTIHQKIRTAITLTYQNTAAIHIKNKNYQRALESAMEAEKLDPENSKVLFRKAQSLIGLGQVNKGKQLLESLQKIKPDLAIVNALNQLQLNEKSGERKVSQTFKGMYSRKPASSTALPEERRFTEIIDGPEDHREPVASTSALSLP